MPVVGILEGEFGEAVLAHKALQARVAVHVLFPGALTAVTLAAVGERTSEQLDIMALTIVIEHVFGATEPLIAYLAFELVYVRHRMPIRAETGHRSTGLKRDRP